MKDKNGINKIDVKIQGKEYSLRGKESVGYLQSISSFVDEKLGEIIQAYPQLNTTMSAVLTAVNIADLYFKEKENVKDNFEAKQLNEKILAEKNRMHDIESQNRELQSKLSESIKKNQELEKQLLNITKSIQESQNKSKESTQYEEDIKTIRKQLDKKEDIINNLNGKVAALNHKYKAVINSMENKDREVQIANEEAKRAKEELNQYIEEFDK